MHAVLKSQSLHLRLECGPCCTVSGDHDVYRVVRQTGGQIHQPVHLVRFAEGSRIEDEGLIGTDAELTPEIGGLAGVY
ncbi:hypothetical protein SAMN05216184_11286 [Georgenia satyanarayanai]|uniref:Uncharacterized protein n=1 Tax=Georgenia satyanarayanai TaxID=860221 RepID=A0A2Y9ARY1_9MICO|nr:hypothetical protein A8987_11286 [Georgenia satyanarayanai]SSA45227.1 hypothetical protein SAMN05216184_11286 [Georgenia satyanarayanai]